MADLFLLFDVAHVQVAFGIGSKIARSIGLLLNKQVETDGRLGQVIGLSFRRKAY